VSVHPGGARTDIANAGLEHAEPHGAGATAERVARARTYNDVLLRMPAEQAARIVVNGVVAGKPRILVGGDAKLVDLLVRLVPGQYPRLTAPIERRLCRAACSGHVG